MADKLLEAFVKKIKTLKIPTYSVGRIMKVDGTTRFFEVVVRRPDKYDKKELIAKIPKTYRGFTVRVF